MGNHRQAEPQSGPSSPGKPRVFPSYHDPAEMLYLKRSNLTHVPDTVLQNSTLTFLCLEGNQISVVPDSLFPGLPRLRWLDLRRNIITLLPPQIGSHRSLETLLLEGNPISELPPELGNVITLRGLSLRDCPLRFPPRETRHQGLPAILRFLRNALAERERAGKTSPGEFPVVEKLQLSDLTGSSAEEQDESVDDDALQRFKELKDSLMQLDQAELNSVARGDKKPKSQVPRIAKRNKEALPKQSTQTENTKEKKTFKLKQKRPQRQRKREPAALCCNSCVILDVDELPDKHYELFVVLQEADSEAGPEDRSGCWPSATDAEQDRSLRKLHQQIYACVERMHETHRNPRGTKSEQMAAVEEDLAEMRKLQARLAQRKQNPTS
ncbi:leucine-rich repeat-containing protein 27-like [Cololabis saira]|uniref:leucine-rich repeat-containing protein 27-like n=1 Tax=Cololabis saira TaxID=129043 RepID=UPI002AD28141|nr:leucine-rich repeat-containing protein 27-like [Cololabis saira]